MLTAERSRRYAPDVPPAIAKIQVLLIIQIPQDSKTFALKLLLATEAQWYITISLIQISIVVWFIRLGRSLSWRISLYSIIVLQTLIGISYTAITFQRLPSTFIPMGANS